MEDKESGSLSQKPVLDLIVDLYQGAVTGSLKLERAPLQKAVYFRDGQILFAASNDPKDQLASILVEEGKLGPDQMQVAQARVSSGNPLAKVLTELGYISQRELADAARIKVEKILTDLYSWNEGTYQFATKSLPKGAIDLDLSTPQLIFASVRRIQNRDWILKALGSLDVVLERGDSLDDFIVETKADDQASEVLRHADGVKTVTQIGALSSLGEFEVCKILAAGLVTGALAKSGETAFTAATDDAFSIPSEPPAFDPDPQFSEEPFGGVETVGLKTNPPSPPSHDPFQVPADDTVFQPPPHDEETEKTVFEAPPGIPSGLPLEPPPPMPSPSSQTSPRMGFGAPNATASELLIDEPEPDVGDEDLASSTRMPPKPRGRQRRASSGNLVGILKIAGVVALAAAAAFSVYFFVWPMFAGEANDSGAPTASATTTPPSPPSTAPSNPEPTDPSAAPTSTDPRASGAPRPAPVQPTPAPTTAPAPTTPAPTAAQPAPVPEATTTSTRRGPSPAPPPSTRPSPAPAPSSSGGGGRQLLAGGDISGAATAFLNELETSSRNKFTVAVGLYCNEENVGRVVQNARGSEQLYVLPTTVQGKRCFRIVWGTFDTRQAAEQSMGSVPNGIRAGDAAAVPIASVLR
jgi:hypothetical protein